MDKGGGVERLPGPFLAELLRGKPAQLVVNQRQELLGGVRVALLDGGQDAGDIGHRRHQQGDGLSRTPPSNPWRWLRNPCRAEASHLVTPHLPSTTQGAMHEYTRRLAPNP